jgi:SAM-dependent methyltransferase
LSPTESLRLGGSFCDSAAIEGEAKQSLGAAAAKPVASPTQLFYEANPYPAMGAAGLYAYLRMKRELLQELGLPLRYLRGRTLLEAACGTGESTLAFARLTSAPAVGVDFSGPSIEIAERLSRELGASDVRFLQRDITALGDVGGPFDIVVCEVVHQTADPHATVRGLAEQVNDGGHLILSVANRLGNLADTMRVHLVTRLAGKDEARRIAVARRLFFNPLAGHTRVRGVRKKVLLNLDAVIADIYGHPFRRNYSAATIVGWLQASGLECVSACPQLPLGPDGRRGRLGTELRMFRDNTYHLAILARKRAR